ncbi:ABC transporter ATP-binding protein [Prosthecomicrobium pneumaticum]|uniref:ATP-binding cassette subfamily B multidrug efflux pump n=1 Tax=Prosthecomicrobium pneumaticum TaxID=81895 RepID=A0A7W9FKZ8_9HYPH|nr:ABC transporter ATP-binding protein [Prosthecomicrobium pneumaticum]MBB5751993.1 ATP-binding cassette subfamily B multidrug efflux pump [Prosthecomicrobium pneumaticum]
MFRYFERLVDPYAERPIATPPAGFLAFIWHFTRPILPILVVSSLLGAAIAALEVVVFSFLGELVDWLSRSDPSTFLAENGARLAVMAAVALVLAPLVQVAWELTFHQAIMPNFPMMVRWRVHRYLLRQGLAFFQDDMAGRIANTMMQTALAVREAVTKVSDILVYVFVYFTGAVVLLASADWRLAGPLVAWFLAYLATLVFFVPRLRTISKDQADARSVMTGRVVDSYTNILTVKLFSHTAWEDVYARESMDGFLVTVRRQMRMVTLLNATLVAINYALLGGTAALSIWLWQGSAVSTGAIAVAIGLVLRLQGMSQWILWEVAALFENVGTVQDGVATLAKPLAVTDRPGAVPLVVRDGAIRFEDVHFHYGRRRGVIAGLDLAIAPHERIGVVGASGAGKSTLTNILLRLYDIERGRILIDGEDIAAVGQESLRSAIGVVTQDTALLHRSVADNIRYGRPDATDAEVIEAAKRAEAHDFILTLEDAKGRKGYDAQVGERGVRLSGGQRQRIAIARVLLKDAPILVLDEATSALDSEVEAAIQESLDTLMAGKTVIAIAHRLSTIARMDRLVVMEAGRIVETGSHAELVAAGGLYARLWARQTGGFLELSPSEAEEAAEEAERRAEAEARRAEEDERAE